MEIGAGGIIKIAEQSNGQVKICQRGIKESLHLFSLKIIESLFYKSKVSEVIFCAGWSR